MTEWIQMLLLIVVAVSYGAELLEIPPESLQSSQILATLSIITVAAGAWGLRQYWRSVKNVI